MSAQATLTAPPPEEAKAPELPVTVIRPTSGWAGLRLHELWSFRELAYFLVWRDIKVRYKQSVLGAAWAVIPPVLMMVVFTLVLQKVAHLSSEGKPYALFSYSGLVPWTLFTTALSGVAASMVGNAQLVSKIYFPRLILPIAASLTPVIDFCIAMVLLAVLMGAYTTAPNLAVLLLPLLLLLTVISAQALGFWFAALNVKYRDFQYTVPFIIQIGLFVTPVAYTTTALPNPIRSILALNPMTSVIEGFRWGLLGTPAPPVSTVAISTVATIIVFGAGLAYFRRAERTFADII